MSWPSSFFVAILTAVVGLFASGFVASLAVGWYRIPGFEAQSAAFTASFAILGLVVGFIIGIVASRVVGGGADPGFLKSLGASQGVLLGLIAVVGVTARLLADVPPRLDGEELMLAVELCWPASQTESPASLPGEPTLVLGSVTRTSRTQRASSTGPLWTSDAHLVDGRWVAPGAVDIFTTRGRLSIVAMLDSATNIGFILPLSGAPGKKDMQWTEWYPHARPGAPPLPDGFRYRYRVQKRSEAVRTETVGPFEIQTIAWQFFNTSMEGGKTVLATNGRFRISYRGQPVIVDAKQSESKAAVERVEKVEGVAVIGAATPALFAHFVDDNGQGPCYIIADASGRLRAEYIPDCLSADGSILTTDTAAFRNGERKVPRGRINRLAFETPGLYNVGGSVVDTRRLAVYQYKYPESFSIFPSNPPLGISPDERSFVRIGSDNNDNTHPSLAVADFVGHRSYLLPVDEARMRYSSLDAIDPAWLSHHFAWEKASGGVDSLVERKTFVPIPYHGTLTLSKDYSAYRLAPAREPLREAIIDFLIQEYKGERLPVGEYAYEHGVKVDGQIVNVAYGDTGGPYVTVSLDRGATDTTLLQAIARRIDAALATGKYDSLFGKHD